MKTKDKVQLNLEIQHIFDSGVNEIRVYEMAIRFIERIEKEARKDCKKEFHNALDEVVSFDGDNEKNNFIIDVLNKINESSMEFKERDKKNPK